MRRLAAFALAFACTQAAAGDGALSDVNYRLGEGLQLADTGFSLGGYATASFEHLHHAPARAALDNLSLFVWWQGESRWKFFSELDYENVLATPVSDREG
ncbi:MAG: hypothetical protein JSR88_13380, partial [Proteobacteria bacterium]|nr:hypothetical protein [Pseudomonadota bacterium]